MKQTRDVRIKMVDHSVHLDIPACGRAYIPKINFRRPGNLILGLFMIFLILLFGGLAFAEDHTHHYGHVHMVVNVASIKAADLRELSGNQIFIPSTGNVQKFTSHFNVPSNEEAERLKRDPPVNNMDKGMDFKKRSAIPIDLAKALLNGVHMAWPNNETLSEVLMDWSKKHEVMTNEQNAQVVRFLFDHFRNKREVSDGIVMSFYEAISRTKRSPVESCDEVKKTALWDNINDKKATILGYKFFNQNNLCVYVKHCSKGFATPAGCDHESEGIAISDKFYYSDEMLETRQDLIPAPNVNDFCELDGMVIKRCERTYETTQRVLFYRVQGNSGYFIGPHAITVSPLYSSLADFNCTGTPSKNCKGDEIFKSLFTQSGADESCVCTGNSSKHMVHVKIGATSYRIDIGFYKTIKVKFSKDKPEDLECVNCDVSCNHGQITIDYDSEVEMVELCSGRYCMDIKPQHHFTVPLSLAALDNSFTYYLRFSDNKEKQGTIQCKIDELCPLIDCHLCIEKIKNPHCYNALDKVNFIIIIATWFILLAIIVKAMKIIIYGAKILSSIIRWVFRLNRFLFKKILKTFGFSLVVEREVNTRLVENHDGSTTSVSSEKKKTCIKKTIMPTYIKPIVLMCIVLPAVLGCSDTQTMDAKQLDCKMIDRDLKCSTKSSAHINVAPVGQSSCFIFKTADGQAAGTLTIKTISLDLLCNKEVLYWTYGATPSFDQVCYCQGSVSGEGNNEKCNLYNKDYKCGKPLACEGAAVYSHCKTARGGWDEGCFLYSDKFCYFSVSMDNPTRKVYEISSCSSFYWQANVEIIIQTINGEEVVRSKLNPGSLVSFTGGSIQLEGASIPPIPILSKCFVKTGGNTWIAECIKGTGIMAGLVGEIQCKSEKDAKSPSYAGCSYAPGIHNVVVQGGSLSYNYHLFDFNTVRKRLPISSGGFTIKEKGGVISASLNYISMISLKLTLSGLTMVPYSIMSKCSAKFVDAKGCTSCLTGAIMRVRVKTDEGQAKAILSCPSLKAEIPFKVTTREEIISLNAHFESGLIKETCKLVCPGNSVDLVVEATLTSDVQITRLFEDNLNDFTEVASNWFSGIFGQFQYYLLVPVVGVVVLGSLLILKFMFGFTNQAVHQKVR